MVPVSIIIPVKHNNEPWHVLALELLQDQEDSALEVIIVSSEAASSTITDKRLKLLHSAPGRARQQNLGAENASYPYLWFLHSDSKLEKDAIKNVRNNLVRKSDAIYFFDLHFQTGGPGFMRLNSIGANWRSHFLKMPFGDQGFFLSKKTFFSLGMFNEQVPYGEDHVLIWRAQQRGIDILSSGMKIFTSPRKYQEQGWFKTTLKHLFLTYLQAFHEWCLKLKLQFFKRPTTAVAIFVKTPGHSSVKSRLAAGIGKEDAEFFFNLSVMATQTFVREAIKKSHGNIEAYWAVAEPEAHSHHLWSDFPVVAQGHGTLGERLHRVYSALLQNHQRVLLIGADSPHLPWKSLLEAHEANLKETPYILGKTEDGGFYLFGGEELIDLKTWTSVEYSSAHTATDLIARLKNENFKYLKESFDIDNREDLKTLSLIPTEDMLPDQKKIIRWAQDRSRS